MGSRQARARHRGAFIWNTIAGLAAILFIRSEFDDALYFYGWHLMQAPFALLFGATLVGFSVWDRERAKLWKRELGWTALCVVLITVPIALLLWQWQSTRQPKVTTVGSIVEKGSFQLQGSYTVSLYRGLLVGVRVGDRVQRFDWSGYQEEFERASVGQAVAITHFRWIRDTFLAIEFR